MYMSELNVLLLESCSQDQFERFSKDKNTLVCVCMSVYNSHYQIIYVPILNPYSK